MNGNVSDIEQAVIELERWRANTLRRLNNARTMIGWLDDQMNMLRDNPGGAGVAAPPPPAGFTTCSECVPHLPATLYAQDPVLGPVAMPYSAALSVGGLEVWTSVVFSATVTGRTPGHFSCPQDGTISAEFEYRFSCNTVLPSPPQLNIRNRTCIDSTLNLASFLTPAEASPFVPIRNMGGAFLGGTCSPVNLAFKFDYSALAPLGNRAYSGLWGSTGSAATDFVTIPVTA